MKHNIPLSFIFVFFSLLFTNAQNDDATDYNTFSLHATTGIGYGQVKNDNQPNYNLDANVGELLITYNFNKKFGISTGIGYLQLSGNGFNTNGNFYHERDLIKLPLMVRSNQYLSDQFNLSIAAGFYGQTIINDEYRYLNSVEKDVYNSWSFGFQGAFSFEYNLSNNWSVGINISTQSDFNKLKTENDASFNDKQTIQTLNTIGLLLGVKF